MIEGIPIVEVGPPALLALVVIMILTGRLVPRSFVAEKDKRIETLDKTNRTLLDQNTELLETSKLGRATWAALERGARD